MFFHWPDHVIGKRESRRIREEHNATVNRLAERCDRLAKALRELLHETDDGTQLCAREFAQNAHLVLNETPAVRNPPA